MSPLKKSKKEKNNFRESKETNNSINDTNPKGLTIDQVKGVAPNLYKEIIESHEKINLKTTYLDNDEELEVEEFLEEDYNENLDEEFNE
ncbi:MAG: hypothetical protein ACFFD1_14675, partial [Candidatus Thorarchaeota archaeon]